MSWDRDKTVEEGEETELGQALGNFRQSVHAWSAAEYGRSPRPVAAARSAWRLASAWALGCVLATGGAAGILVERHHTQVLARAAAGRNAPVLQAAAPPAPVVAAPAAPGVRANKTADEILLADVDSDVSRTVPSAMEPLAQLMVSNSTSSQ